MTAINPNSSAVEVAGASIGGDVSSAVIAWFGARGDEASKKVKSAMAKADRDKNINKMADDAKNGIVLNGTGGGTIGKDSATMDLLQGSAFKDNQTAQSLVQKVNSGAELDSNDVAAAKDLVGGMVKQVSAQSGSQVSDDQVNLALVQAAFQEFQNAIQGLTNVVKKSGDTKDAIVANMK